ncbi:cytochrome o ubiquinol oxidase subunit IV [Sphingomonas sp.]|uniref:cytochrome o ubiquinol oxidase subunit IV n=1 Tax=Sphingomonas sp. TaxID=28214 RepID=UPI003CC6DC89
MSEGGDRAPGEATAEGPDIAGAVRGYLIGFALATLATIASFAVAAGYGWVWPPGIPIALIALAVGQMGVHLVFFLHITTGPDNTNNVLALAFGTLIAGLVLIGSLWIMAHVDHHAMSPAAMARMQR